MKIELKSNRRFIIWMILPFLILMSLGLGAEIALLFLGYGTDSYLYLVAFACFVSLFILIILVALFKKRPTYIFKEDYIFIQSKDGSLSSIRIDVLNSIDYYPLCPRNFFTLFGEKDKVPMKLHVTQNNGYKIPLGFVSAKDARRLKELYSDILRIHD